MPEQKTFFDIPPVDLSERPSAKKRIYAVYKFRDGEKHYLWKELPNDCIMFISETQLEEDTRKKPMILNLASAKRRIKELATSYGQDSDALSFEIWERD